MSTVHILVSSNRWFSAVSDYCLQLGRHLHQSGHRTVFAVPDSSPLQTRAGEIELRTLPLWPNGVKATVRSWATLSQLLQELRGQKVVVWTFEGREHSLCAFQRRARPALWRSASLVRVRGQAAPAKDNAVNRWLYRHGTDRVVFAAQVVAERTPFAAGVPHSRVHRYCADFVSERPCPALDPHFVPGVPPLDLSRPTFLVVARFDPVKGHSWLLESFARLELSDNLPGAQLVFVGRSENIRAPQLIGEAGARLGGTCVSSEARHFAADPADRKRVYLYDERLAELGDLYRQAHFGVIPSLGSEVICRVAVEFLQSGTPLIVSAVGALPEVAAPEVSTVVRPQSEPELRAALANALAQIAERPREHQELRERCRAIGFERYALNKYQELVDWVELA